MPTIPIVNRLWSVRQFQRGQSAVEGFDVTGVESDNEAIAATGWGELVSHPQDSRLIVPVGGISVTQPRGPILRRVMFNFASNSPGAIAGNPLDQPAEATFAFTASNEPLSFAFDKEGEPRPVTNSAQSPFANDLNDLFTSIHFTLSQYESTFDGPKAVAYCCPRPKMNSDAFTIPGIGTFLPGQLRMNSITSPDKIRCIASDPVKPHLNVSYAIEARDYYTLKDGTKVTGFAKRVIDQGLEGYVLPEGEENRTTGQIVHGSPDDQGNWVAVSSEVLLDGKGTPFDYNKYRVVNADTVTSPDTEFQEKIICEFTDNGVFLYFIPCEFIPFSGLGLKFTLP